MVSAVVHPGTAARLVRAVVGRRALRVLVLLAGLVVIGLVCGERARAAESGGAAGPANAADAVRGVTRPVVEPAVRPARDVVDEAARGAQEGAPARALSDSTRALSSPTRALAAPTQVPPESRRMLSEPERVLSESRRVLPQPKRVLPEPRQALPEPRQTSPEPTQALPAPKRALPESRQALVDAGGLVPKAKVLLAEPQRVLAAPQRVLAEPQRWLAESQRVLPETLRPGAGGGAGRGGDDGGGATGPGPSGGEGGRGASGDARSGHDGGRDSADADRGAAAYGPCLDSSYPCGSWTSPYGEDSGGRRGGEVRDGVGAAFGEHGTGGSEKAPLPGRPGGCVSGQSAGDGSSQRHADAGAVGPGGRGEVRLAAGPGAAAGAAPVRDRHRDILEFPG
ncbi:hypothetical protein [Streptomyces sp. NPDC127108]|uniref:hypothetical protein n=1 Tax=Streptomyces sp. NPDC127108 TaxID=3345361 RepID=UPI00362881AE